MNFTNAYDLNLFLYKKGLIQGLYLSERGDYEIESAITDSNLIEILNEIWTAWRWGETDDGFNAIHSGYYSLFIDSENNLGMDISIADDILGYSDCPFDIEKILSIISNSLILTSIDNDEDLEFQIGLDLELEYENFNELKYEFSEFRIKSRNAGDAISKEISSKMDLFDLNSTKKIVSEYFLEIHKQNQHYESFSLKIKDNYFQEYIGTGNDEVQGLKTFLEAQIIDIDLDNMANAKEI